MKSIKSILFFSLIATTLWGCENASEQQTAGNKHDHAANEQAESTSSSGLLNQKWVVNEEMKPFVAEAEAIVDAYVSNGETDYLTLAANLEEKNTQLIKSCTMDGESHDALHEWLYPHIELLKALEKAESVEAANGVVGQLQTSFETYHIYFQ